MDNYHSKEKLTEDKADEMLKKIFEGANVEPNKVPLKVITSYQNYRRRRFIIQKAAIGAALLLLFILPIFFISPSFSVTPHGGHDLSDYDPVYDLTVNKSLLPIKSMTASMGQETWDITETDGSTYFIRPRGNGTMTVSVALTNGQYKSLDVTVEGVDTACPKLIKTKRTDNEVLLYLEDVDSGIDYAAVTGTDADGNTVSPLSINEAEGIVIFAYPSSDTTVDIPDKADNVLEIVLTNS